MVNLKKLCVGALLATTICGMGALTPSAEAGKIEDVQARGISLVGDEVWFSLGSGLSYTYAQRFGDDVYEIKSDGRSGAIYKNRIAVGSARCGVRLVTNRDGKILRTVKIEEGV